MLSANILAGCRWLGRSASVLILAASLAGCGQTQTGEAQGGPRPSALAPASVQPALQPTPRSTTRPLYPPTNQSPVQLTNQATLQPPIQTPTSPVLGELSGSGLDLRAGPVEEPIELRLPSIGVVSAPVLGVGITPDNVMDAPKGPIGDAIWQTAFWYRGSGVPGVSGTAVMAGHVDDPLGRPAIFARLQDLQPGDPVVVHNTRTGLDIRFVVTQTVTYSLQQTADPAVLAQIYGAGPVSGKGPQPAPDGLSHLTLITCTGYIINGSFDHHVVTYAIASPP